jgi:hypothetical protein
MEQLTKTFLKTYDFKLAKDVSEKELCDILCKHFDALLFNISSLACIVVTLNEDKKLDKKHIPVIKQYIMKHCVATKSSVMRGGHTVMASDFFGYNHPNYSASNAGEDILGIDLDNGTLARPALGPMSGGGASDVATMSKSKFVKDLVKAVFDENKIKYSSEAFKEILNIADSHMKCLARDLRKCEPLTIKKVEALLAKKRYFVFK